MSKSEVVDSVVEPESTEIVAVDGMSLDLWKDSDSTFVPSLKKDMPLVQRKEVVRQVCKQASMIEDKLNLINGEMLYEVSKNGYWKDWMFKDEEGEERKYASFEEYINNELNVQRRTVYYQISIYEKFVVELELPLDTLRGLEWSKVKELVPIINEDNWSDLLDKVSGMSVSQVKRLTSELRTDGKGVTKVGTGGVSESEPGEVMKKRIFRLAAEQDENIGSALKIAETMVESKSEGHALDLICSEFIASTVGMGLEGALAKLDVVIKNVERAFAVKLEISEVDEERYADLKEDDDESEEVDETEAEDIEDTEVEEPVAAE